MDSPDLCHITIVGNLKKKKKTIMAPSSFLPFLLRKHFKCLKVVTFELVCTGLIPYFSSIPLKPFANKERVPGRITYLLRSSTTVEQFIIRTALQKPCSLFVKSSKDTFVLLSCIIQKYSSSLNMHINTHIPMNS